MALNEHQIGCLNELDEAGRDLEAKKKAYELAQRTYTSALTRARQHLPGIIKDELSNILQSRGRDDD